MQLPAFLMTKIEAMKIAVGEIRLSTGLMICVQQSLMLLQRALYFVHRKLSLIHILPSSSHLCQSHYTADSEQNVSSGVDA